MIAYKTRISKLLLLIFKEIKNNNKNNNKNNDNDNDINNSPL